METSPADQFGRSGVHSPVVTSWATFCPNDVLLISDQYPPFARRSVSTFKKYPSFNFTRWKELQGIATQHSVNAFNTTELYT